MPSTSSLRVTARSAPAQLMRGTPCSRPARRTNASSRFSRPGLGAQLVGRAVGDDAALGDDDDAVAERRHLLHDVAREHHAAAVGAQAADHLAHGARAHHIEPVGGFVEDHVARLMHERAGQRHLGAFALREAGHAAVGQRVEAEPRDEPGGAVLAWRRAAGRAAARSTRCARGP